jgi:hypothetical protein
MRRLLADAWTLRQLSDGWELAGTAPGLLEQADGLDELDWVPAAVPSTVSATLAAHDRNDVRLADLDAWDWWFRTTVEGWSGGEPEQAVLWLDGLATIAEVRLGGELILESASMFCRHAVTLAATTGVRELTVCLRALRPLLSVRRKPRARWRTQLVGARPDWRPERRSSGPIVRSCSSGGGGWQSATYGFAPTSSTARGGCRFAVGSPRSPPAGRSRASPWRWPDLTPKPRPNW